MGNRAVITTENKKIGIYLHWNGGRSSVEGFLKFCELSKYRATENDSYGWAYLCGVISNFFGSGLSVGIDILSNLDCDNGDNGTFIIKDWKIIGREYFSGFEEDNYSLIDMLYHINSKMPEHMKLSEEIINNAKL